MPIPLPYFLRNIRPKQAAAASARKPISAPMACPPEATKSTSSPRRGTISIAPIRTERRPSHRVAEPQLTVAGYEPSTYWLAYSQAVAAKLTELEKSIAFDIIQFPEYGGEGYVEDAVESKGKS